MNLGCVWNREKNSKPRTFTGNDNRSYITLQWDYEDGMYYVFSSPELSSLVSSNTDKSTATMKCSNFLRKSSLFFFT